MGSIIKLVGWRYVTLMSIVFCSCNTAEITRDYLYYSKWAAGEYQGFTISKIKLLDSSLSVFDENFNSMNLDEYSVDSSFCFGVVSDEDNRVRKDRMYFSKPNKGTKFFKCLDGYDKSDIIGRLDLDTWYLISGLSGTKRVVLYVDTIGKAHPYLLGPENW